MVKFKPSLLSLILLATIFISGCVQDPVEISPDPQKPPISVSPQPTPTVVDEGPQNTPEPTTTPELEGNVPGAETLQIAYQIDAALNYDEKTVEVHQTVTLEKLPEDVLGIAMIVEPNRYANGFSLQSLEIVGIGPVEYSLDGNRLDFNLPTLNTGGDGQEFVLVYSIRLPAIPPPSEMYKPQPYGFTDRQLNLVDWYAFVPPLDENNQWIIHQPPVFGESLVYPAASLQLDLTVIGSNMPLVVAASSLPQRVENTYSYSFDRVRTFGVSVSPYYAEIQGEALGIVVKAYAFAGYEAQNRMVLQNALEAVALFSEQFGVLPRGSISIVQADFLDGMEFDGLYFVSKGFYDLFDGSVKGYLTLITVHEMAHQWWFGVVGNDQAMDPWLDESLATFAEQLYFERYFPDLVEWWRYYRVAYYEPEGKIDLSIYEYGSYAAYRNAVYLRGAKFLENFREAIGRERFEVGLKQYFDTNKFKIASGDGFFSAFNLVSLGELDQVKGDYFE